MIMPELIQGIPNLHLFLFGGGLIAAVVILIVLKVRGSHQSKSSDEFGENDE
jgi:hypothetical protein